MEIIDRIQVAQSILDNVANELFQYDSEDTFFYKADAAITLDQAMALINDALGYLNMEGNRL